MKPALYNEKARRWRASRLRGGRGRWALRHLCRLRAVDLLSAVRQHLRGDLRIGLDQRNLITNDVGGFVERRVLGLLRIGFCLDLCLQAALVGVEAVVTVVRVVGGIRRAAVATEDRLAAVTEVGLQ